MVYAPYAEEDDDHLAQLCQVQIFFSLLSSITLKYDVVRARCLNAGSLARAHSPPCASPHMLEQSTLANATNIDVLLTVITFVPVALAFYMESPVPGILMDFWTKHGAKITTKLSDCSNWMRKPRSTTVPGEKYTSSGGAESSSTSSTIDTVTIEMGDSAPASSDAASASDKPSDSNASRRPTLPGIKRAEKDTRI